MSAVIECVVVREKRTIMRARVFPAGANIEEVMAFLYRESFTGRLTVDMSQGGVCAVQAEDRTDRPLDRV